MTTKGNEPTDFPNQIDRLSVLLTEGKYREAWVLLAGLENAPYSPQLLMLKGMLIANLDVEDAPNESLDTALSYLQLAHRIDPLNIAVVIELANWQWAVMNDPEAALKSFELARDLSDSALREALAGRVRCFLDWRARER